MTPREEWREAWRRARWLLADERLGPEPDGPSRGGHMVAAGDCYEARDADDQVHEMFRRRIRMPPLSEHRRYCREVLA